MKPRHAAALALVGWYLMGPATRPSLTPIPLTDRPLVEWQILSSWETQKDCDGALKAWIHTLATSYINTRSQTASTKEEFVRVRTEAEQARHSICVASDDPRLKPK
jgi:hypothetical protein